eukprot:scaffold24446_cov97-Skeletonema_dohrnii-CCMP3373.AAC.2
MCGEASAPVWLAIYSSGHVLGGEVGLLSISWLTFDEARARGKFTWCARNDEVAVAGVHQLMELVQLMLLEKKDY